MDIFYNVLKPKSIFCQFIFQNQAEIVQFYDNHSTLPDHHSANQYWQDMYPVFKASGQCDCQYDLKLRRDLNSHRNLSLNRKLRVCQPRLLRQTKPRTPLW